MKLNLERKSYLSREHRISIIKWLPLKRRPAPIPKEYYENMSDGLLIDELLMEIF